MQSRKNRLFRQLLATTLLIGGSFNLVAPVLAAGTAAGQSISNTATGTYEDSNNPGVRIDATSNTVTLKVAEVASIDVTAISSPVTANPGGNLTYDFKVTNTGNDLTKFVLPKDASLTGTGAGSGTVTSIIYSKDATFGNTGDTTYAPTDATKTFTTDAIKADEAVYVRVVVTLSNNATGGQDIQVEYGSTSKPADTNQDYAANTTGSLDAYTEDVADSTNTPGEAPGAPVNGVREDSATLNGSIGTVASLVNGPNGQAGAVGPDNTTITDFSSKSTEVPANSAPGTPIDPAPVTFTNTVSNTTNAPQPITIMPTTVTGMNLKDGTEVTITDPATNRSAKYTYRNGAFTSTDTAVVLTVPQGGTGNYTVTVDLPTGTELSTDLKTPGDLNTAVGGYKVPIAAFVDAGTPGVLDTTDVQNITTDTAYVGLLAMYKEAKITDDKGAVVQDFTSDSTLLDGKLLPGYFVEYRIRYKNISNATDPTSNSKPSTATNVVITEDGTTSGNNWGLDNDEVGGIDTTHVSAVGTQVSNLTNTAGDITGYTDTVGNVAPQQTGQLLIKRKLN